MPIVTMCGTLTTVVDLDYFFCDPEKDESGLFIDDPELLALTKEMFHA